MRMVATAVWRAEGAKLPSAGVSLPSLRTFSGGGPC